MFVGILTYHSLLQQPANSNFKKTTILSASDKGSCLSCFVRALVHWKIKKIISWKHKWKKWPFRQDFIPFFQVEIGLSEVNCLEWLRRLEREIWNSACHIFTTASFFRPWKTYYCILLHSAIYSSQYA